MVVHRREILVPLGHNPIEEFLLAACLISGVTGFNTRPFGLPTWAAVIWYGLLAAGGLTWLVGAVWRDALTGLLIQRAALIPVGFGAYGWAVLTVYGGGVNAKGLLGAFILVYFGSAVHRRAYQITGYLRAGRQR